MTLIETLAREACGWHEEGRPEPELCCCTEIQSALRKLGEKLTKVEFLQVCKNFYCKHSDNSECLRHAMKELLK